MRISINFSSSTKKKFIINKISFESYRPITYIYKIIMIKYLIIGENLLDKKNSLSFKTNNNNKMMMMMMID